MDEPDGMGRVESVRDSREQLEREIRIAWPAAEHVGERPRWERLARHEQAAAVLTDLADAEERGVSQLGASAGQPAEASAGASVRHGLRAHLERGRASV